MITEDYVSFEIAKLLKEKGFDEMTELAYGLEHGHIRSDLPVSYWRNSEIGEHKFSCPTLQMAMKWLREKHNQNVTVKAFNNVARLKRTYYAEVQNLLEPGEKGFCVNGCTFEDSYEQACEAAIKYCLENLI